MQQFVAEQYLSAADTNADPQRAGAARAAAEQLTREGTPVRYVRAIFIPEDETCIHIYWADSIEGVRAAGTRASLRFDRISEAISDSGRQCASAE